MSTPSSTPVTAHADHRTVVVPFRAGDRGPLGEAYLRVRPRFAGRGVRYGLDEQRSEELFHEAFEAMLTSFCRVDFQLTCPLEAYLQAVFHNKALAYLRKTRREGVRILPAADLPAEGSDPLLLAEEVERDADWHRLLRRTFGQLGQRCRRLLRQAAAGTPAAETARQLEMTNANAVYQARLRCRAAWDRLIRGDDGFSASKPERW